MTTSVISVKGLACIEIFVTDLTRAADFYVDVLGFTRKEYAPPGLLLGAPGLAVYLEGGKRSHPVDGGTTRVSPSFQVESVRATYRALVGRGVNVTVPYQEFSESFAMFAILDPDDNALSFSGKP